MKALEDQEGDDDDTLNLTQGDEESQDESDDNDNEEGSDEDEQGSESDEDVEGMMADMERDNQRNIWADARELLCLALPSKTALICLFFQTYIFHIFSLVPSISFYFSDI